MYEHITVSATTHKRIKMTDKPWHLRGIDEVLNDLTKEGWEHYHTVFVEKGEQIGEEAHSPAVILHLRRKRELDNTY